MEKTIRSKATLREKANIDKFFARFFNRTCNSEETSPQPKDGRRSVKLAKQFLEMARVDCDQYIITQTQKEFNMNKEEEEVISSQEEIRKESNTTLCDSTDDEYPLEINYAPMDPDQASSRKSDEFLSSPGNLLMI